MFFRQCTTPKDLPFQIQYVLIYQRDRREREREREREKGLIIQYNREMTKESQNKMPHIHH